MSKVTAPARPMTQKRLRGLTPESATAMLTEYVETEIGYRGLSDKYRVSQPLIVRLIQGSTYRDWNWPAFADLRRRAQQKATSRSLLQTKAVGVRVPDVSLPCISYNPRSLPSIREAKQLLDAVEVALTREAGESNATDEAMPA